MVLVELCASKEDMLVLGAFQIEYKLIGYFRQAFAV